MFIQQTTRLNVSMKQRYVIIIELTLQQYNQMKNDRALLTKAQQQPTKFLPSPQTKQLILNYFKYNNFQDFNTWQQIAKTKLEYDYEEHPKEFTCNITLKWEDWHWPQIFGKAKASTKKTAKKRALGELVDALICQGYIGRGFKEENFIDKLPRRRRNQGDQSSEEQQQIRLPQNSELLQMIRQKKYEQSLNLLQKNLSQGNHLQLYYCWNHALKIRSMAFIQSILRILSGEEITQVKFEHQQKRFSIPLRQHFDGSQVKAPFEEDLTDFIRHYQLQKDLKPVKIRSPSFKVRQLPSQNLMLKTLNITATRAQILQHFHPIQASTLFVQNQQKSKQDVSPIGLLNFQLPHFEPDKIEVTIKMVEQLYSLLLFYSQHYQFCIEVLSIFQKMLTSVTLNMVHNFQHKQTEQGEKYYLANKNMLAAQFLELINLRINNYRNAIRIEGMLLPKKNDQKYFVFNPKQSQQIIARKINKKINSSEFQQMRQIANRQMVLLVSKFSGKWVGQIVELSPSIKLWIPQIQETLNEPHPVTLYRLCNAKVFEKTSSALIETSKHCMNLLQKHTHLIWQPPTYPIIPVITELLIEWQTSRHTILVVTPNSQQLHQHLTSLGFKATFLLPKTQQKTLIKNNIVVSSPSTVCCDLLRNYAFTRVLVESAHSLSEVSILSSLVKDCQEAWLIGDPYLPKMPIFSTYSQKKGLNISLFQRLIKEGKPYLTFQSKIQTSFLHKNVLEWADEYVYSNKLRLLGVENQLPMIKGFNWPSTNHRICFLHTPIIQEKQSYLNKQAQICAAIFKEVVKSGYTNSDQISCSTTITESIPYLKQQIANILKTYSIENINKRLEKIVHMVSGSRYFMGEISILVTGFGSVDGINDIVGGLLQGKRGVIVVGDAYRLSANDDWSSFIGWCKQNKLMCIAQL